MLQLYAAKLKESRDEILRLMDWIRPSFDLERLRESMENGRARNISDTWYRLLPQEGVGTVLRPFPPPTSWLPTPFLRGRPQISHRVRSRTTC